MKDSQNQYDELHAKMLSGANELLKKVQAGVLLINQPDIDGDTPRLRAINGHEVIVYKGFDLWDSSKSRSKPKIIKMNATEEEAIRWMTLSNFK